ncbi:hypothetical protein Ddc_22041 [Ditylenchus destructor]|nr:hypothetical protein Ddc_22041 [Ditylenchus destructor]
MTSGCGRSFGAWVAPSAIPERGPASRDAAPGSSWKKRAIDAPSRNRHARWKESAPMRATHPNGMRLARRAALLSTAFAAILATRPGPGRARDRFHRIDRDHLDVRRPGRGVHGPEVRPVLQDPDRSGRAGAVRRAARRRRPPGPHGRRHTSFPASGPRPSRAGLSISPTPVHLDETPAFPDRRRLRAAGADRASGPDRHPPDAAERAVSSGQPEPVIARFLPGQRFDLQATIKPDAGQRITAARFLIDGKPVDATVALRDCAAGCVKGVSAETAIATVRAVGIEKPGRHQFSVEATQADGQKPLAMDTFRRPRW